MSKHGPSGFEEYNSGHRGADGVRGLMTTLHFAARGRGFDRLGVRYACACVLEAILESDGQCHFVAQTDL